MKRELPQSAANRGLGMLGRSAGRSGSMTGNPHEDILRPHSMVQALGSRPTVDLESLD